MVIKDNLFFDAQPRLKSGIDKTARALGITMGTGGSNTIIEAIESPGHMPTNDGYTIANSIHFQDPIEDMGRKMLVEAINRANKASGDGSSTTCVLTAAIINEGLLALAADPTLHKMDLKRQIETELSAIEKSLEDGSHIIDVDAVGQVATISAEDPAIGAMIQEIYEKIGKTGLIHWDVSKTGSDSYTVGSGITVDWAGFVSPYLCDAEENGSNTMQVRLANPKILITKQALKTASDFEVLGAALFQNDVRDLVVFCDEYDPLIIQDLVKTRMVRGFRFILVKMPTLWKDQWYEDLALATGATVIDPTAGLPMREATAKHLGTVGNILITKDQTFLDGILDLNEHVSALEAEGTDESILRASRLNTKTARYFVGANSESALSHRRFKVEDAIAAAYHALNGGVVVGGGVALLNAANAVSDTKGADVLRKALTAPLQQIISNAGSAQSISELGGSIGFNSRTGTVVDMFEAGITDPKVIVLNAAKNAVSVAAAIITAPTIITLPRQEEESNSLNTPDVVMR